MECINCRKTLVGSEVPSEVAGVIKTAVFSLKKQLSAFTGLIVLILLIGLGVVAAKDSRANEAAFVAAPVVNDVYIIKMSQVFGEKNDGFNYGTMQIVSIDGGRVGFRVSATVYSKAKGPRKDVRSGKAWKASYYDGTPVYFTIPQLKTMNEASAFYSIDRQS